MFKRKAVSFNLDCPHQKELYEWCVSHPNFSGFVKSVLFHHYNNKVQATSPMNEINVQENDVDLVSDIL